MRKFVIVVGASVAAGAIAVLVVRTLRAREAGAGTRQGSFEPEHGGVVPPVVVAQGMGGVDPQPMTQIAGEGVDLDTAPGADLLPPRVGQTK